MTLRASLLLAASLILSCGETNKPTPKLDASKSTVTVDKTSATANDTEEITVTIKTVDEDGAGIDVTGATIAVTGTGNTLVQPPGGSSNGSTSGRVRSTKAEAKTISVTVKSDGADVALPQTQAVTFVAGDVSQILFTTQPSDVQVGAVMSPVVVTAFDGHGNIATNENLTIALRLTGNNVPTFDGGVGVTDGGVLVFDALIFDGPGTSLGMQARCQGCSQPWAADATTPFNVTP